MLICAIKYCSTFKAYLYEREKLRMALLLNKYLSEPVSTKNYNILRDKMIYMHMQKKKIPIDYGRTMFVHFTYCLNMKTFPTKFHALWNKYFIQSPINEIKQVLGTRNIKNLQRQLIHNK
ncbi:unnamed protein product [Rotaria sp. Silwood1]|nr:unnamed protein product [Rotaria sp. Silwood1]CAF4900737.1 unnamed protein product [Rotaria sp. Silwood1]CAF5036574.1 unnamed protein product [Rotaria sp. Silwood1]